MPPKVPFAGRGKALVVELPGPRRGPGRGEALPLWLMALARRPAGQEPEDGGPAGASAVLVASACVDLQQELAQAATDARCSPFRRCSFRLTPVQDAGCQLTLDCFLRVYEGGHRELAGGELLLEPSVLAPFPAAAPQDPAPWARTGLPSGARPGSRPGSRMASHQEAAAEAEKQPLLSSMQVPTAPGVSAA